MSPPAMNESYDTSVSVGERVRLNRLCLRKSSHVPTSFLGLSFLLKRVLFYH